MCPGILAPHGPLHVSKGFGLDKVTRACSDRTGVQLKDKWRNLVKFKHVSRTEAENAASRSPGYRIRWCSGSFLHGSRSVAELHVSSR